MGGFNMQREFNESWSKLCQCVNKPIVEFTELNMTTMNNLARNMGSLGEVTQAKKPEELLAAQVKLANVTCQEAAKYTQRALDISFNAVSEAGKIWTDALRQHTERASEMTRMGTSKERE